MMKAIELFAGAGGLGLGVTSAGFKAAQIVEWDRWCCETIRHNQRRKTKFVSQWPEPIEGDVRAVDFAAWENKVELVSGGPPCQPFSLGGKHRAFDDKRDMWPEAVRAIRQIKPKSFIFENVKGLTRASFITYFTYIKLQLEYPELHRKLDEDWREHLARLEQHHTSGSNAGLRYQVIAEVLNAADYGVPQRRERVVFVGFRADLGIRWSFPSQTHSSDRLAWDQCRDETYWDRHRVARRNRDVDARFYERAMALKTMPQKKAWRTVRDAIGDMPEPQPKNGSDSSFANHFLQPGARSYPGHTGSPLDEPAKTLKAGVHGVPGGENMLLRPDGTVRYFSVRESARLQTFPDSYQFNGSWSEAMRQIGNAVPVNLARIVAADVKRQLVAHG